MDALEMYEKTGLPDRHTNGPVTDPYNPLTGLMVREAFVAAAQALSRTQPGPWCCVAIDIQHFKIFNAWFGYEKGDYLLSRIGSCLRQFQKDADAVAGYFGRDNFALFLRHEPEEIRQLHERIKDIINFYSNAIGFLPAFGICLMTGEAGLDLYDRARLAVEDAKQSYTDRIRYFDAERFDRRRDEYQLMTEFMAALDSNEISFYIQPQCRTSTGRIVGGEALGRWIKPDGTMIPPGAFVPFLENNGLITELDKRIWESVCRWLRSLVQRGIEPLPISVNVSQVDLLAMDVASYLYGLTERFNVPQRLIKVEITESAYAANFDLVSRTITDLQKKGFLVMMDDFGSGYSSLNMLDQINADVLKLDMAFMRKGSHLSKKDISIVESIFSMARVMELPIVVEGVENESQLAFLQNLGCRYAQGYHFYRPMSQADFEKLLCDPQKTDFRGIRKGGTELFHAREFLNESMFTESALNNVLGAVAFYALEGENLTITRFNEPFYRAIGDAQMETRRTAIQHYVVKEDWPMLYDALDAAQKNAADGGICEVRFYKSDDSVFWFHMRFFFLKEDGGKKLFYGQVEDVTAQREQSIYFFETLRQQADITMRMNLDRNVIAYVTGGNTLFRTELPSMDLDESVRRTMANRMENEEDRRRFREFFDCDRLREVYRKAVYHETLQVDFRLTDKIEPMEFSTYYIRYSKDQDLYVYAFGKRRK